MSGVWRKEQERPDAPLIEYSAEALEAAERGIAFQEEVWERMFNDLRIEALRLWHEDVLCDGAAAVRAVADYLGVAVDASAAVVVPQIEKQSEGDAHEWAERYSGFR